MYGLQFCKSADELKREYHRLARKNHPDVGGDADTMQKINAEYRKFLEKLSMSRKTGGFSAENDFSGKSNCEESHGNTSEDGPKRRRKYRKTLYTERAVKNHIEKVINDFGRVKSPDGRNLCGFSTDEDCILCYAYGYKFLVFKYFKADDSGMRLFTARRYNEIPEKYKHLFYQSV